MYICIFFVKDNTIPNYSDIAYTHLLKHQTAFSLKDNINKTTIVGLVVYTTMAIVVLLLKWNIGP